MKSLLSLLLTLVVSIAAAQPGQQVCKEAFFQSGELSSRICKPLAGKLGEAVAFSRDGKEIYRGEIHDQGMYTQVRFTYYADGGVKLAKSSWQPDGGKHSGSMVTEFDRKGKVVAEHKIESPNNPDAEALKAPVIPGQGPDFTLKIEPAPQVIPPTRESLAFVVNHTRHSLTYKMIDFEAPQIEFMMRDEVTVPPGDTVNVGYFKQQGDFPDLCKLLEMEVTAKRKCHLKKVREECGFRKEDMPNPAVRHYYFTSQPR